MNYGGIIIAGMVFIIRPAAERNTGHVHAWAIDHPFIVGDHLGELAFTKFFSILFEHRLSDAVHQVVILARVLQHQIVAIAGHLDKNSTLQMRDQVFMMRQVCNAADGFRAKQKTDAHRSGRQRLFCQAPGDFDRGSHSRRVIIGLGGMTGMGADQAARRHPRLPRLMDG